MACVGSNNQNSFGILASLDIPPPNELSQVLSRNSGKKSAARDPEPAKSQRNTDQRCNVRQPCKPVPRQNGNNNAHWQVCKCAHLTVELATASYRLQGRDRNNVVCQDKGRNCDPASIPPRFRNQRIESRGAPQGFCGPTPQPCSGDPCLTSTSLSLETKLLNMQYKQILAAMQNKSLTTCPQTPASIPPPICGPIASKKDPSPPIPNPPRANQTAAKEDDVVCSSTPTPRTVGRERSPRTPEKDTSPPIPNPPRANQTAAKGDNVVCSSTPTPRTVSRERSPRTPEKDTSPPIPNPPRANQTAAKGDNVRSSLTLRQVQPPRSIHPKTSM
ncbi:hypothetical protein HD554DRAFT_706731 [Boletus coccyginus]|nr:hypothetical protein HD554DRAFT_706731 [Boletus coccyginus]